jgi:hypothetical protein
MRPLTQLFCCSSINPIVQIYLARFRSLKRKTIPMKTNSKVLTFIMVLLTLMLVMLMSLVSMAQKPAFGLKGGVNFTTLKLSDADATAESSSGFHAGFFVRERISKVGFQPEFLISTMRTNVSSSALGDYEDRFTYLSVPMMVKFYLIGGLNIHAGPQFSFLLDGDRVYNGPFGSDKEDIKDYYKAADVSISMGGGWDLPFGLSLDLRYNIGVRDINEASGGEEARSRVFQASLGWNFAK